jgi:hypothetical protein
MTFVSYQNILLARSSKACCLVHFSLQISGLRNKASSETLPPVSTFVSNVVHEETTSLFVALFEREHPVSKTKGNSISNFFIKNV